ncbi:MAG: ATP-binding cassette domain-containing protein [Halanaerobiales bacterium]
MTGEVVKMENINKTFGKIQALKDVDFTVYPEEIVGLVGDNGAGKSTLIKILVGALKPDPGAKIFFKGEEVKINNPRDAINLGIESIYQDSSLVDQLNVPRNLFLGREPTKKAGPFRSLDFEKMNKEAEKLLKEIGIENIDLKSPIQTMSGGERQSIAIARAMYFEKDLIILDEPTNHLGIKESQSVLDFLVQAKNDGHSSIFITHNIHHIYQVADRIVVMRRGKKVGDFKKDETNPEEVEALIVGKEMLVS